MNQLAECRGHQLYGMPYQACGGIHYFLKLCVHSTKLPKSCNINSLYQPVAQREQLVYNKVLTAHCYCLGARLSLSPHAGTVSLVPAGSSGQIALLYGPAST